MTEAPRIPPLSPEGQDDQARQFLAGVAPTAAATNIFTTLVRHPGLFRKWIPFSGKLLSGKLPPRHRELLILRTGWRCRSEYEFGQHTIIGRQVGLTDEEIQRVKDGPDASGWDPFETVLLRAADELHDSGTLSDATWETLAGRYNELQLIEVPMLVGHYHLVSFALNTLRVQREPGVPGFDG